MAGHLEMYGVNTYPFTFSMSALDAIRHLADQGYRAFEPMMFPGHIWPGTATSAERNALASFLSANRLRVTTLNQPNIDINIGAAVPEMREFSTTAIERTIMLAADIGAESVIIGPGKPNPLLPAPREVMRSRCFAAFDRFTRLADRLGVRLLVENMPFAFVPDVGALVDLLEDYGSERIGVVYDVANGAFIGEEFEQAFEILGPRFAFIHLSDTPREVCRHDPIGRGGVVRFDRIWPVLEAAGHKEPLIIEVVSDRPDSDIPDSIRALQALGWP